MKYNFNFNTMEIQNTEDKPEIKKASSNELKKRVQDYRKTYELLGLSVIRNEEIPLMIEQEINPNIYSFLI